MLEPDIGDNNDELSRIVRKYGKDKKKKETPKEEESEKSISDSSSKKSDKSVKNKSEKKSESKQNDGENGEIKIKNSVLNEFKENVKQYVLLDDKIRKLGQNMKELKEERKPYEAKILEFMEKYEKSMIQITNGKLRLNKAESKTPLKLDIIRTTLTEKLKDPKEAENWMKAMEAKRLTVERRNLKRTKGSVD
jgi:hypothetical protein